MSARKLNRALAATSSATAELPELARPGLLAAGIALALLQAQPAHAVKLGELRVQSALGQHLVATTTARLGPGETLSSGCVSAPALRGNDLGNPTGLTVTTPVAGTPGTYPIEIRSTQPLYEPMYEIRLQVKCPGSVALTRNFVVMLNLPMTSPAAARPAAPASRASGAPAVTTTPAPARTLQRVSDPRLEPAADSIASGASYRVRKGDTLSSIAARVSGRPTGSLWQTVEGIYAANPDVFIRGDRDMIKLGWTIRIPDSAGFDGAAAAAAPEAPAALPANTATQPVAPPVSAADTTAPAPASVAAATALAAIRAENLTSELQATEAANAAVQAEITRAEVRIAALEAAAAARAAQDATPPAAAPAAAAAPQRTDMNPLLAILAGLAGGLGLALLVLGRGLLGKRRDAEEEHAATAIQPARQFRSVAVGEATAAPVYGGGGIEVEVSAAGESVAATEDHPTINEAARVSLADLPVAESPVTDFDDMLDDADDSAAQDDGTMQAIFDPATAADALELPGTEDLVAADDDTTEIAAAHADEFADSGDRGDLDTINRRLQMNEDEALSATLTQALDLLEQDYEDELSAIQILERDQVVAALREEAAKDHN